MSGGETKKVSCEDLQRVQNRIELCLRRYMNREEVVQTLLNEDNIQPRFTQIVWHRLEEENRDFFKAYYLKLMLKEQIIKFNQLLAEHASLMRQLEPRPSEIAPLSVSNGSHISSIYQNVMDVFRVANPNGMPAFQAVPADLPNAFSGCSSTLHPCMQPMGNLSAQNGKVAVNPNILLAEPSNVGMASPMNLIKSETGYDNRSPFDFGAHGNLFEPCSAMGDASISSFSSAESNTQHPNEAFLDADTSWLHPNFNFPDLTADFPNNPGVNERFENPSDFQYDGFSGD